MNKHTKDCTESEWTHYKDTHFDRFYFGTLSKLRKTDVVRRLKVDINGTQHFGSEVSERLRSSQTARGKKKM